MKASVGTIRRVEFCADCRKPCRPPVQPSGSSAPRCHACRRRKGWAK